MTTTTTEIAQARQNARLSLQEALDLINGNMGMGLTGADLASIESGEHTLGPTTQKAIIVLYQSNAHLEPESLPEDVLSDQKASKVQQARLRCLLDKPEAAKLLGVSEESIVEAELKGRIGRAKAMEWILKYEEYYNEHAHEIAQYNAELEAVVGQATEQPAPVKRGRKSKQQPVNQDAAFDALYNSPTPPSPGTGSTPVTLSLDEYIKMLNTIHYLRGYVEGAQGKPLELNER